MHLFFTSRLRFGEGGGREVVLGVRKGVRVPIVEGVC